MHATRLSDLNIVTGVFFFPALLFLTIATLYVIRRAGGI